MTGVVLVVASSLAVLPSSPGSCYTQLFSVLLLVNPLPKDVQYLQQVVGTSSTPILEASNIPDPIPLCFCLHKATLDPVFLRAVALDWLKRCGLQWSLNEVNDNVPTGVIEGSYRNSVVVFPVSVVLRRVPVL